MTLRRSEQALKGAAGKAQKVEEQENRKRQQRENDDGGGERMRGGHPSEPDGQNIFAETERPIAERLRNRVDRDARAGFGAVRSESDAASEEGSGPTPFDGSRDCRAI